MSTRRAKRPGLIEAPSGVINTIQEKVKVGNKIMVITSYICERSITIYIGSYGVYCIDAQILKNANNDILSTALLTKIRWDGECSLYDAFEKGSDTIMIFNLLLTYIKDKYPQVKQLLFTDMSVRECDNNRSVNLAAMKIFTDGISWYETHFNAKLHDNYKTQYENMISYSNKIKTNMSWDTFLQYTSLNIPINIEIVKEYYNLTKTWKDFFYKVREKIGVSSFCIWLSENDWFNTFIQTQLLFNTMSIQYYIEPSEFNTEYTIIKNKGGSRYKSHTLKRKIKRV